MKNRNLLFYLGALIGGAGLLMIATSWTDHFSYQTAVKAGGGDGVQKAAAYLQKIRSNQLTGVVEIKDVLKAREQVAHLTGKSGHRLSMQWNELGPDNYAGRTRAILIDHRDPTGKTVYAASVNGGIWKTTNGGQTWSRVNGFDENPNIVCIAQASNGDIYAGTGEYFVSANDNIARVSGFVGRGIYRSTDGDNYQVIPATVPDIQEGIASQWAFVNKLAIDLNSGRIYAATNGGLVYSDNNFSTYTFAQTSESMPLDTIATDVDVASNGMVTAVVASHCYVSASGGPAGFVNQSTRYYSAPDTLVNEDKLPRDNIARLELEIAPSNNDIIYAMAASSLDAVHQLDYGELEGIYLSEDKGETWMLIGPGGSDGFNVLGDAANYLGFYNNTLAVHPTDPYKVLAGGFDMWEGEKVNGTGYYNWSRKSSSVPLFFTYIHSSHHIYMYNPENPSICYVGSDGGVFVTDDGFTSFRSVNRQYNTCQFYSVGFDRQGKVIGGTQGNGVIYLNYEGNTPETGTQLGWPFIDLNGGYQEISMIMPHCFIMSGEALNLLRSDDQGRNFSPVFIPGSIVNAGAFFTPFALWESFNNQNSRDSVTFIAEQSYSAGDTVMVISANADYPFDYITPAGINEGDLVKVKDIVSARFFLSVRNGVYMTTEVLDFTKEPVFYKIAAITGLPVCIAYSADANYIYVGTDGGNVYRIANVALAYDLATADVSSNSCIIATTLVTTFQGRTITSIAVDPTNYDHVVITLGNYGNTDYIYQTTNAIDSLPAFASIQGDLPQMPIYSSLIEMNSGDRILLGTELGIWSTDNAGKSTGWINENDGMGNVPVFMLKQQRLGQYPISNFGVIYAATFGRGLFKSEDFVGINDPVLPGPVLSKMIKVYPNPAQDEMTVLFKLGRKELVSVELYDFSGRKIMDVMPPTMTMEGEYSLPVNISSLRSGAYVLMLTTESQQITSKFVVLR